MGNEADRVWNVQKTKAKNNKLEQEGRAGINSHTHEEGVCEVSRLPVVIQPDWLATMYYTTNVPQLTSVTSCTE